MSPSAPAAPCATPGCPHLRPCPVHPKRPWEHDRSSATARGYGPAWRKLRAAILERDGGLCVPCRAEGRESPAMSVDHVTPRAEGGTDDPLNLVSLCAPCRAEKDARDAAAGRRRAGC